MAAADDAGLTAEQRINKLFRTALALDASLVWESGQPPRVSLRRDGLPREVVMASLPREEMGALLRSVMGNRQWGALQETGAAEFSHAPDMGGPGLRVSVYTNSGQLRVTARPLRWDDSGPASALGQR